MGKYLVKIYKPLKIYIISQWYFPEPDGRVSALAEGLVARGHDIIVITAFPNYPKGKIYDGYSIKWRQWDELNGVRILRLPIFPDHSDSAIKRILNYISFSLSLFLIAPWFIKKPDVLWAYTPFMVLPTLWFKKILKTSYVLEITDIWPDTIFATGMLKQGFLASILNKIANLGYKYSAAITVQNIGFKSCLVDRGVNENKIHIVENWADEAIFRPVNYNIDLSKKYKMDNKFNIMFAGNMGTAQGLFNIIEAAILCKDIKDIQFVFVGDGVCLKEIKDKVVKEGLKNVCFIERQPINEMPYFFAISDVLLVSLRDEPLFELTLPSKTQAYLACGKPIIIAKRGEDAKMLKEKGCALVCEPDNPKALFDLVIQFFNMDSSERATMGKYSLSLYKERYNKDRLLQKMEEVLRNAA